MNSTNLATNKTQQPCKSTTMNKKWNVGTSTRNALTCTGFSIGKFYFLVYAHLQAMNMVLLVAIQKP